MHHRSALNPNEARPILVVSPPRSGSSLTSNLLMKLGLFGGEMKMGDKWNAKGYFENVGVTRLVIDYLRKHDEQNLGKKFHPRNLVADDERFGEKVISEIWSQGYRGERRWFYKNTKTPLCWRLWHRHFPDAQWVIVQRRRFEILNSLEKTEFMDAYETREDWSAFLDLYDELLSEIESNCNTFLFNIGSIIRDDAEQIEALFRYISVDKIDNAKGCIDRRLWNSEKE